MQDLIENAFYIRVHVIVPNANDLEPVSDQLCIANRISGFMMRSRVLTAVKLHDDSRMVARKINDEVLEWYLTSEMESELAQLTQMQPEFDLLARHS